MAASYVPAVYAATTILDPRSRLIVNRFTGGWSVATRNAVKAAGGIDRWFAQQLSPTTISDAFYTGSQKWWYANVGTPKELWARDDAGTEGVWEANAHYQRWSMLRRMYSQRQVQESMAAFWEHHFHVPANGGDAGGHRNHYGRMIRAKALGRFDTLLNAVITHPAMGLYLGNASSTKRAPNENLGRELLELHTVGRSAGYTEDDVKNSARIITGWRVDLWDTWDDYYDTNSHWTGAVKVLGFSHPNTSADGRAVTKAYLDYLAHHPATAQRIARKLAVRFVSDTPSSALVGHLASVYLASGTAMAPVLKALVASAEFQASAGKKTRTPEEDVIATYRALGATVAPPKSADSAAVAMLWQTEQIGLQPFGWPRPDGRPDTADAWSSVSRILGSFDVHYSMSGRWWPSNGVTYRSPAGWLPKSSIRFDALVDHLSRSLLGRGSTALTLQVACQATGLSPTTVITATHDLVRWGFPALLTVFLDSPTHIAR
ncbi:MAG: DUF1800 domain-containing protein [Marmoricola sp.]